MALAPDAPVLLNTLDAEYVIPSRILTVVWEGSTSAGNRVELTDPTDSSKVLWQCRAGTETHTYLGINLGEKGQHAPNGFKATTLDAGEVLVYLRAD